MPGMPRKPKSEKILIQIIGKPQNLQDGRRINRRREEVNPYLNKEMDIWYNHPI